jgi:uncharacterized membrane protein YidH (DUF202 family)
MFVAIFRLKKMELVYLFLCIYLAGCLVALIIIHFVNANDDGSRLKVPYPFAYSSWLFVAMVVVIVIRVLNK